MSLLDYKVFFRRNSLFARASLWKGRGASKEHLIAYHRVSEISSPLDLIERWKLKREPHARFFGMPGEPELQVPQSLSRCLERVCALLSITPPPHGKYSSHSLRIGAHTEQVLLGIPLEARKARFGWSPGNVEQPSTYFDRSLRTSAAAVWFFGSHATHQVVDSDEDE